MTQNEIAELIESKDAKQVAGQIAEILKTSGLSSAYQIAGLAIATAAKTGCFPPGLQQSVFDTFQDALRTVLNSMPSSVVGGKSSTSIIAKEN